MTTADYRRLARECEQRLDWAGAADYWQKAIESYPRPYPQIGALAAADIARMTSYRDAASYAAMHA